MQNFSDSKRFLKRKFKPTPEKWSKKEIIGHLCDSALTNIRRFVVTQYKENENVVHNQDVWEKPKTIRIPDEALQKTCDTIKTEPQVFTLEFMINDYVDHLQHH